MHEISVFDMYAPINFAKEKNFFTSNAVAFWKVSLVQKGCKEPDNYK